MPTLLAVAAVIHLLRRTNALLHLSFRTVHGNRQFSVSVQPLKQCLLCASVTLKAYHLYLSATIALNSACMGINHELKYILRGKTYRVYKRY